MKYLLAICLLATARYIKNTLSFNLEDDWKYLGKFSPSTPGSNWISRARLIGADADSEGTLGIHNVIYIDSKWQEARDLKTCNEKVFFSKRISEMQVPLNGSWSNYAVGSIHQGSKTHFWYFAVGICDINSKTKLEVEINIVNSDNSLYSAEEKGLNWIFPLVLSVYLICLYDNLSKLVSSLRKKSEIEPHMIIINLAVGLQVTGIAIGSLHMIIYGYNGYGIGFFYIFYQLLEVFSSTAVFLLLIIIANGWTIKFKELKDLDVYIPVALLLTVINLIHVSIEKGNEETYNSFSNYDGVSGIIFCFFRVMLWIWFLYSVVALAKESNQRLYDFLLNFGILGSVYFLNLPFVILLSWCFDHYTRNKIVICLVNLIQIVVFFYLSHMFGGKSSFYKLSTLSQSTLPGKIQ